MNYKVSELIEWMTRNDRVAVADHVRIIAGDNQFIATTEFARYLTGKEMSMMQSELVGYIAEFRRADDIFAGKADRLVCDNGMNDDAIQVGDHLKITGCTSGHGFEIGQLVEVVVVQCPASVKCVGVGSGGTWFLDPQTEAVKVDKPSVNAGVLKPGTKVRITGNCNLHGHEIGSTAVINKLEYKDEQDGRLGNIYRTTDHYMVRDCDFEVITGDIQPGDKVRITSCTHTEAPIGRHFLEIGTEAAVVQPRGDEYEGYWVLEGAHKYGNLSQTVRQDDFVKI